ncbi:hypothetical protein C0J52_28000 [Blattella germanica]|nr:hypothetical protein C0J52_28000 [Blattella germanica]
MNTNREQHLQQNQRSPLIMGSINERNLSAHTIINDSVPQRTVLADSKFRLFSYIFILYHKVGKDRYHSWKCLKSVELDKETWFANKLSAFTISRSHVPLRDCGNYKVLLNDKRDLGIEGLNFIKEIGQRISRVSQNPKSTAFLIQRISITLQRGNVASILGTLPRGMELEDIFRSKNKRFSSWDSGGVRSSLQQSELPATTSLPRDQQSSNVDAWLDLQI